jgi:membrane protease YdiL (CAAX protease family)
MEVELERQIRSNARQRAAALLEVFGIYLAGQLLTRQLIRVLSLQPVNPLNSLTVEVTDADLLRATWQLFVLLILQYAGWFLLIIPINYWRRRSGPAAYGITFAGYSWKALMVAGLSTAALCVWPTLAIDLANALHPVGETVAWRQALFDTSWRRWEFWLFTGIISWGMVAVIEEIFFRGYCQRRLAEDWGDGPAIAAITCLFVFAHAQYLQPNWYNAVKLPTLMLAALGSGVVFARTRSLLPSILAHAISNFPMTPIWQGVVIATFCLLATVTARSGAKALKQVFSSAPAVWYIVLGVTGAAYSIAASRIQGMVFVAAVLVLLAVALEAMDGRRQEPSVTSLRS